MIPSELHHRIMGRLAEHEARLGAPIPTPQVTYETRGLVAGRAYCGRGRIDLNPHHLLDPETQQDMIDDTLGHEYAHLVVWALYRERGHGRAWKQVMWQLGLEPSRCYKYNGSKFRVRKVSRPHEYRCSCRTHHLTTRMHHSILRGRRRICRYCDRILRHVSLQAEIDRKLGLAPAEAPKPGHITLADIDKKLGLK